jgi:hypothetical protein
MSGLALLLPLTEVLGSPDTGPGLLPSPQAAINNVAQHAAAIHAGLEYDRFPELRNILVILSSYKTRPYQ